MSTPLGCGKGDAESEARPRQQDTARRALSQASTMRGARRCGRARPSSLPPICGAQREQVARALQEPSDGGARSEPCHGQAESARERHVPVCSEEVDGGAEADGELGAGEDVGGALGQDFR